MVYGYLMVKLRVRAAVHCPEEKQLTAIERCTRCRHSEGLNTLHVICGLLPELEAEASVTVEPRSKW